MLNPLSLVNGNRCQASHIQERCQLLHRKANFVEPASRHIDHIARMQRGIHATSRLEKTVEADVLCLAALQTMNDFDLRVIAGSITQSACFSEKHGEVCIVS